MPLDEDFIEQAALHAKQLLEALGNRWLHVQAVAEKARYISVAFPADDRPYLIVAAYLHDIGYAPALKQTGFHPLDGAYYIRSWGDDRLVSLVAHHSEARFEARLRGLEHLLDEFPRERSAVADALAYCDQTTGPTGISVSLKDRAAEVFRRYGETALVSQALRQAFPYLSLAVARTQRRLRMVDINGRF